MRGHPSGSLSGLRALVMKAVSVSCVCLPRNLKPKGLLRNAASAQVVYRFQASVHTIDGEKVKFCLTHAVIVNLVANSRAPEHEGDEAIDNEVACWQSNRELFVCVWCVPCMFELRSQQMFTCCGCAVWSPDDYPEPFQVGGRGPGQWRKSYVPVHGIAVGSTFLLYVIYFSFLFKL